MTLSPRRFGGFLLTIASWCVIVYLMLPLVVIIGVSLTIANYMSFTPHGLSLNWYTQVINNPVYIDAFWLSLKISAVATIVALALGVPAAIILARKRFFGARAINALFLSPLILPTIVLGVAVLQFASAIGLGRSFLTLLIGHIVLIVPYVIRSTLVSLAGFDLSTEEAAQDLGASTATTMMLVTLPLIKPGVIAGGLFAFIMSWINVEVSIFSSSSSLMTLPVRIFGEVQSSVDPSMAAVSALTIYLSVVVVLVLDMFVGLRRTGMT
jgi:putative spermidine/putrescine transport system permease protein